MFRVDVDFAYSGSSEAWEITLLERDYGVKAQIVGRANGWPVLRVRSTDRKILEDLLEARDESWRAEEIHGDEDDYIDGTAMYGNHAII